MSNLATSPYALEYLTPERLSHPATFYTLVASVLFLVVAMGTYGAWYAGRSPSSSYSAVESETMPSITDDDFSYITSEELEDQALFSGSLAERTRRSASPSTEDDVLIIKNRGITYPAHFPAFAIFDGKVCVKDVMNQLGDMMDLSERSTRDIKLLYKGRYMSNEDAPIRDYGLKDNSQILAVVRDLDRKEGHGRSSPSSNQVTPLLAEEDAGGRRNKKRRGERTTPEHSPTFGNSSGTLGDSEPEKNGSEKPAASIAPSGPVEKLEAIAAYLDAHLIPECNSFVASPPRDAKKLADEHSKLTETIFQKVLLKLDEVDTEGNEDARARRKQLVRHTQGVMKRLDDAKNRK